MPTWLVVQRSKSVLILILYDSINGMRHTYELSESHLSCAKAMFVVNCCQFGPNCVFLLKTELMACPSLVGGTTEQSSLLPHLLLEYRLRETLPKWLYSSSVVPQPFLFLIAANLALTGFLG